jgi:recombination protein RecA
MSQALRKLTANLNRSRTICIFINQLREKIGVMFGSPETTSGGRALKFYSSVRLDIRRVETIKDGAEMIGNRTRVKVAKNKVAPPFKLAEFDIMYGKGISREGSLLDVAVDLGIIKKSGAWFTYEGEQLGQGRENAKQFLADNVDMVFEIMEKIKVEAGIGDTVAVPEGDVEIDVTGDAPSANANANANGDAGGDSGGDSLELETPPKAAKPSPKAESKSKA